MFDHVKIRVRDKRASEGFCDEVWEAGTRAGYLEDGPPGPRPQCRSDYYGVEGDDIEGVDRLRS